MIVFLLTKYKAFESGSFQSIPKKEADKLIKDGKAVCSGDFDPNNQAHYPDTHTQTLYKTRVMKAEK